MSNIARAVVNEAKADLRTFRSVERDLALCRRVNAKLDATGQWINAGRIERLERELRLISASLDARYEEINALLA